MKTRMLFILAIALAFVACESDTDFATPADQSANALNSQNVVSDSDLPQGLVACMDVSTTHDMSGFSTLKGTYYSSFFGPRGTYEVSASGTVISDPLKDGDTQIRFTYNTQTQFLAGTLVSQFKNGQVLTQKFEGPASRSVNGKEMTLTVNLTYGLLENSNENMEASEGMISITLPSIPIGAIDLTVQTRGTYCTLD